MRLDRLSWIPLLPSMFASLTACASESKTPEDFVRDAIARTERLQRHYLYSQRSGPTNVSVDAFVEDDVRYSAKISFDGVATAEEIVRDVKFPSNKPLSELARIAIDSVNAVLTGQGLDVIEVRTLTVKLTQLGKKVMVQLPDSFVEGNLAAIRN